MIRNRFQRHPQKGRNPQNLHVIRTAPAANLNIIHQINQAVVEIPPTQGLNITKQNFFSQTKNFNAYKNKFNKQRKSRKRRKKGKPANKSMLQNDFNWSNPDHVEPLQTETESLPAKAESPPLEESEKMESTPDAPVEENYFEEVEVASEEAESKQETLVRFRKTKPCYLKYKKKGVFKPKFYRVAEPTFVNCLNVQEDVDVDIVSEAEYEYETDNLERSDSQEMLNKIIEVDDSDDTVDLQVEERETSQDAVTDGEPLVDSTTRMYKTCIKGDDDFTQGKSLIQNSLDSWKSHLIGLEYLIEIQNADMDSVSEYHCVLCEDHLKVQEFPAVCVINHISSCKHVVKYLEKHFPAHGYKFTENSDYNIVHLQKLAEEINQSLGYYFMCISNLAYFVKNDKNMKKIINDAYHPNEKDFVLDKNVFQQKVDSALNEEIKTIVSNVVEKAVSLKEGNLVPKVKANKSIPESTQSHLQVSETSVDSREAKSAVDNSTCVSDELNSKNKKRPKYVVYKGNSALASYMALSRVAKSALKKPAKKNTNANHKASDADGNLKGKGLGTVPIIQNASSGNVDHETKKNVKHDAAKNKKDVNHEDVEVICLEDSEDEEDLPKDVEDNEAVEEVDNEEMEDGDDEEMDDGDNEAVEDVNNEAGENDHEDCSSAAALSTVIASDTNQKGHKIREKLPLKPSTVHSKYCRKRILGKESSRLKPSVRASTKDGVSSVSKKCAVKHKSVTESASLDTSRKVTEANKEKLKLVKTVKSSSEKRIPVIETRSVQKTPIDSRHSSVHHRTVHKRNSTPTDQMLLQSNTSTDQISVTKNAPSVWKPIVRTTSPVKSSSNSTRPLRNLERKQSRSPRRTARKVSKSPTKKSKSPIRHVKRSSAEGPVRRTSKSPVKKHSRSPLRKKSRSPIRRKSRSPIRKKSRSPIRKKSKSPIRKKSRSPLRKKSRSPIRKKSRSPLRKKSRSPLRKKSRSPLRRQSRSPLRHHARSPLRRHSRSPLRLHVRSPLRHRSRSPLKRRSRSPFRLRSRSPRRRSRSPIRRRSRSPLRHLSRSPLGRQSRSPLRRHSRSPLRRHSRSPVRRRSRSTGRRYSRSPVRHHSRSSTRRHSRSPRRLSRSPLKRRSRSPDRRHSRSPLQNFSKMMSDKYRSAHRVHSPDFGHSHSNQKRFGSEERTLGDMYNYDKRLGSLSEFSKVKEACKMLNLLNSSKRSASKSQPFSHTSLRDISDLDPVSDEDESLYFSDKNQRVEDTSPSSKTMLTKLLQKFSMADVNPNDPALNKLLQFMEAHSSEIQDLIGSQHKSAASVTKVDSNLQERSFFLQQYLLSNLAGNIQEPRLSSTASTVSPKFAPQLPFLHVAPGFGHPTNVPPPTIPQPTQQRFFPPNVSVPPPQLFPQINQPHQDFQPKPNVPPEVMFKDLKATVNKLFGANEAAMKQEKHQMTGYVTLPDPEKWDLNHPDTAKFNASMGSKNVFDPQGKNVEFSHIAQNPAIREEIPVFNNNNNPQGQFFGNRGPSGNRPQIPAVPIPPPDAKVSFCEVSRSSSKGNLFPVVNAHGNPNFNASSSRGGVSDVKVSLAQRLASVLVKVGMIDVPAPLLQEMLMKIGAFSSSPRQDISEAEILSILKRLGYLS